MPDTKILAFSGFRKSGSIRFHDIGKRKEMPSLNLSVSGIPYAFSPDGKMIACVDDKT